MEVTWIKGTVSNISAKYPADNVLIFHDQQSDTIDFTEAVHDHYEVDVFPFSTKGYEIWSFKTGKFVHAGDGGVRKWHFDGCWERTDNVVDFFPREPCSY